MKEIIIFISITLCATSSVFPFLCLSILVKLEMKKLLRIAIIGTLCTSGLQAENSSNHSKAVSLYNEAVTLHKQGEYLKSLEKLKTAVDLSPNFTKARHAYIKLDRTKDKLIYAKRVAALKTVVVDKIDLNNDSLQMTLEKLSDQISQYNKANKTKHIANFVVVDPARKLAKAKIKFTLSNVPATVVLDNAMLMANARYKIETYVIKIYPN